jgi:hypothetical protein
MAEEKEKDAGRQVVLWIVTVLLLALAAWMYFRK